LEIWGCAFTEQDLISMIACLVIITHHPNLHLCLIFDNDNMFALINFAISGGRRVLGILPIQNSFPNNEHPQ